MRLLVGLIITVLISSLVIGPVLANENRIDDQKNKDEDSYYSEERYSHLEQDGYDERHHCKLRVPESFSTTVDLTIDKTLIEATPHWVLLAAGKTEQKALLNYIQQADISKAKKSQWTRFMMKVWMKYPVKYIKTDGAARLIPGGKTNKFSLTIQEDATFKEIELYIGKDMIDTSPKLGETLSSVVIMPQWAQPDHSSFTGIALMKEGIPNELITKGKDAAAAPDDQPNYWDDRLPIPYSHQLNHGYVPTSIPFTGLAPSNAGENASYAKANFQIHQYATAFENIGYASHFMEDVGNPYHTPMVQIIPLLYIDDPFFPSVVGSYEKLHDKYEEFVTNHWGDTYESIATSVTDYVIITDPEASAKDLAFTSWVENPVLVYACFWHHMIIGNYEFGSNPLITSITKDRVIQTERYTRGLVRYLTGGQPLMISITATAGTGGSITPSGIISVPYGTTQSYTATANAGYVIDDVKVDGYTQGGSGTSLHQVMVTATLSDHTISATFKPTAPPQPGIVPLCPAGTPFDATKYPQNTPRSNPEEFTCSWDGTGRVYTSGEKSALTGIYSDDGYTITIQPSNAYFETPVHWAYQHPPVELTSGMRRGLNTLTLTVENWNRYSMSYGSITGTGIDQIPYIVQVNSQTLGVQEPAPVDTPAMILNETIELADGVTIGG